MKLLLIYTSHNGQTAKIMRRIQTRLSANYACDLIRLQAKTVINLDDYQAVILGTSIRYGYYSKTAKKFIANNYEQLNNKISAFFGVNLVARKAHKNTPETNLYTKKFLSKIKWIPTLKAVFAGALYYPQYNFFDRAAIRFIMWIGGGDTDTSKPIIEFTDWHKVDAFAQDFAKLLDIHANS